MALDRYHLIFVSFTTDIAISLPDDFFDLDVALIELPKGKAFVFDKDLNVNSICLPNKIDKIDESWNKKMFTMAGFGDINPKGDTPKKLQYANKCMKI